MSTSTNKIAEERSKKGDPRWLSGFAVVGSLLALPGLLPVVSGELNLDGDARQTGSGFMAFGVGFLLATGVSGPLLKKFGVRALTGCGLSFAIASLAALALQTPLISFWWGLVALAGTGVGSGAAATACLFALTPWSSRAGAVALPRVAELAGLGCIFACVAGGSGYASGWGRLTPVPLAVGALGCLLLCMAGRRPLAVVEKRSTGGDARTRQLRSIASFLMLSLLFAQLGSEWSVAAWLPLYLIHRLGLGPSAAILALGFYFVALLLGRAGARRLTMRVGRRTLAISGAGLALAGCVVLSLSTSLVGIVPAILLLAGGFAPAYSILRSTLDESLHLAPGFYRAILAAAVGGAMFAAWLLGYVHELFGMGAMSLFAAAGSLAVLALELLLLFEAHLMGERAAGVRPDLALGERRTS